MTTPKDSTQMPYLFWASTEVPISWDAEVGMWLKAGEETLRSIELGIDQARRNEGNEMKP